MQGRTTVTFEEYVQSGRSLYKEFADVVSSIIEAALIDSGCSLSAAAEAREEARRGCEEAGRRDRNATAVHRDDGQMAAMEEVAEPGLRDAKAARAVVSVSRPKECAVRTKMDSCRLTL